MFPYHDLIEFYKYSRLNGGTLTRMMRGMTGRATESGNFHPDEMVAKRFMLFTYIREYMPQNHNYYSSQAGHFPLLEVVQ